MSEEAYPRVLYVGNLDASVTEDLLVTLFGQLGSCMGCKLIRETGSDMYAFMEFEKHNDARLALAAMNKRELLGKEMKVNWATTPGQGKVDISKHYHVFVGDLSPDIESHQLREAFSPFGAISDCKITRDSNTHQSKGYGFVCFFRREDAEMAIAGMNGQWLGGKAIRTNWANGKSNANSGREPQHNELSRPALKYEDVFSQSSPTNCTVYCGGIQSDLTEELMREHFNEFGNILDVKVFREKAFAFIRFDTKESATKAIVGLNGSQINGFNVKCSWGKETFSSTSTQSSTSSQMSQQPYSPYVPQGYGTPGYYGQAGYWGYPQQAYYPMPPAGYMPGYTPQNYGYGDYSQQPYLNGNASASWQPPPPPQPSRPQ